MTPTTWANMTIISKWKGMFSIYMKILKCMKETGARIRTMGKGNGRKCPGIIIRASLITGKCMDKGFCSGLMGINMKGSL